MLYDFNKLSVVIPNWNGRILLERHLPLVLAHTKGAEIIVVDDCSTDDSVPFLKDKFPQVKVIEKKINEGFSSSVNSGVSAATQELILLLNTDIEPTENFLVSVFPLFENEKLFAVGLKDKSVEKSGDVYRGRGVTCFKRGMYTHKKGDIKNTSTAWVSGGSSVFRKSIWLKLNGLDTLYNPFYMEDIDLSYRAIKSGFIIRFEPNSLVIHKHDEGAIKKQFTSQEIKRIAFRNQLLFHWKNLTDFKYRCLHFFWLPYHILQMWRFHGLYVSLGFLDAIKNTKNIKRNSSFLYSDSWVFSQMPKE